MMSLYQIGIFLYGAAAHFLSIFSKKPRRWVQGRKDWQTKLRKAILQHPSPGNWIWMHCSSLGEFEQGRTLIEEIRAQYPNQKVLLTFFSPSGYEIRKDYRFADHVCYLPLDTRKNVRSFLNIVPIQAAVFIKYDLWLNFIFECHKREIPLYLVSAIVREDSKFLKSMLKGLYKKAFQSFSWIFTQDEASQKLLAEFSGTDRISVAGDTRFDRAAQLPEKFEEIPAISGFLGEKPCIVVGSPWAPDLEIVLPAISELRAYGMKWIIAPHEIDKKWIAKRVAENPTNEAMYSEIDKASADTEILWIDNVGMLNRLYHYSKIAYIGGGFGVAVHNTQEPAVYGNPVIFGPKYHKFKECVDMVAAGGAISITSQTELVAALKRWLDDPRLLAETRAQNADYMQSQAGATPLVLKKWVESGILGAK